MTKEKMEGGLDIKVVEKAGVKLGKLLPGLKGKEECGRVDCFVHTSGGKGNCNRESVVYKGTCLTCRDKGKRSVYVGETSRSGYIRGRQHIEAIKDHRKHGNNAFAKHIEEEHGGRKTEFRMDIVKHLRTPLERQVSEGVEIARAKADLILNSKLDYFQPGMKRITFGDIYELG